ncbi:MAG: hypothetical protein ABFD77_03095 [Thermotogota bacterium]
MQGINDRGLYFDLFSAPLRSTPAPLQGSGNLPAGGSRQGAAIEHGMMTTCATVPEALAFLRARDYAGNEPEVQVFVADRAGDAAVYTGKQDVFRTTPDSPSPTSGSTTHRSAAGRATATTSPRR